MKGRGSKNADDKEWMKHPAVLLGALAAFTLLGAVVFFLVEGRYEHIGEDHVEDSRDLIIDDLWRAATFEANIKTKGKDKGKGKAKSKDKSKHAEQGDGTLKVTRKQWAKVADDALEDYEDMIMRQMAKGFSPGDKGRWSFGTCLYYAITVYTTIGYGNVTPHTALGKIATIIYCIIGIPFAMLVFTELGKCLTRWLKTAGREIRKMSDSDSAGRRKKNDDLKLQDEPKIDDNFDFSLSVSVGLLASYCVAGAIMYMIWHPHWSFFDAFYFVFVTLSTVGFGDIVPDSPGFFIGTSIYIIFGLILVTLVFSVLQARMEEKADLKKIEESITEAKEKLSELPEQIVSKVENVAAAESDRLTKAIERTKATLPAAFEVDYPPEDFRPELLTES